MNCKLLKTLCLALVATTSFGKQSELTNYTSFEGLKSGSFDKLETPVGTWIPGEGRSIVDHKHAKTGSQCLHITGGAKSSVILDTADDADTSGVLTFWAERWTSRSPFSFRIEKSHGDNWKEIFNGDSKVKVGRSFLNHVKIPLGDNRIQKLRFTVTSPPNTGVLIDDLRIAPAKPQKILGVGVVPMTLPALVGLESSPFAKLKIETAGALKPISMVGLHGKVVGKDLASVRIAGLDTQPNADGTIHIQVPEGRLKMEEGENFLVVEGTLKDGADIDGQVGVAISKVTLSNGQSYQLGDEPSVQRLGIAVRDGGDDGVHTYRIPGLVTTNKGTLIGVYDIRNRSGGDLPGDIDVGMSRSIDGGHTWEPMKVIMDMGDDPKWHYDGIGDPAILVDRNTGTIWVASTWSHGTRSWRGSGPGLEPEETGQLMLVRSDDDGVTWSKPINITKQVKRPEWCFLLQGPGKGITMKDGTIVFAAQYQDPPEKKRLPHSTILYSKDHGKTWHIGTGAFDDTTEAQVVEVEPGALMLNCRYNRKGYRVVMTTKDMGKTWQKHPTSERSLIEPGACMASLIDAGDWLLFSNPDSSRGRHHITIKASPDRGLTWPNANRLLLDEGRGRGYSCMTMIDEKTICILYEGSQAHMTFQRVPLCDLISEKPLKTSALEDVNRPNLLFIISEDNSDHLGCYGEKRVHTPNLDALAAGGVRYTRAYVPYSVCSPSRAVFLTGLYTRQTGHIGLATHRFSMFRDFKTMPAYFREAGYYTGFLGKTHVNPERMVEDHVDHQAISNSNFSKTISIESYAAEAGEVMKNAEAQGKPFLLIINYADAHRKFVGKSKHGYPTVMVDEEIEPFPWIGSDSPLLRKEIQNYFNCMNRLDEGIGMVLQKLDEAGVRDNTLVVYISDHGADFPRAKGSIYENGTRIPMIINYPKGFAEGKVEKGMVSTIDILPTMLKVAGLNVPKHLPGIPLQEIDSGKFYPRKYIHTFTTGSSPNLLYLQFGIRNDRYKLVYNPDRAVNRLAVSRYQNSQLPEAQYVQSFVKPPEYELFDLQEDPHEWNNLADSAEHSSIRKRLLKEMQLFQNNIHDPFANQDNLKTFIAEQKEYQSKPYRKAGFRWPHLEMFEKAQKGVGISDPASAK